MPAFWVRSRQIVDFPLILALPVHLQHVDVQERGIFEDFVECHHVPLGISHVSMSTDVIDLLPPQSSSQ